MKNHYIYIHKNPQNSEVFYVGQGTHHINKSKDRAYSKKSRSRWWHDYVNKYGSPQVEIIFEKLDKETVDKIEIFLISAISFGLLKTNGFLNLFLYFKYSTNFKNSDTLVNSFI